MKKLVVALLMVAFLAPAPVWAAKATVAVYSDGDAVLEVAILNADVQRIYGVEDGKVVDTGFMLFENGHRWWIAYKGAQAEAFDMALAVSDVKQPDYAAIKVTKTNRTKTVGALTGVIYEYDAFEMQGELVVSDDPVAAIASPCIISIFSDTMALLLGANIGLGPILDKINQGQPKPLGLLDVEGLKLTEVRTVEVADDYFKLPDNVKIVSAESWF